MQLKRILFAGAFGLAALHAAPAALAAPCAGFSDVDDTVVGAAFCQHVEWVKNRAVTAGCGAGTTYCPNDAVTRLQMAAFMRRLGDALTPTFLRKRQTGVELGALNYTATQTVCNTDAAGSGIAITGYPRTAILTGLLNAFTPNDGFDLEAKLVVSVNGGAFQAVPAGDGFAYGSLHVLSPPYDLSLRPYTFVDLDAGSSYRFALQGRKTAGAGSVANTYCELHVQIVSRTGSATPFDEQPDARPPGRGM